MLVRITKTQDVPVARLWLDLADDERKRVEAAEYGKEYERTAAIAVVDDLRETLKVAIARRLNDKTTDSSHAD
jgi:hypothetical protein